MPSAKQLAARKRLAAASRAASKKVHADPRLNFHVQVRKELKR